MRDFVRAFFLSVAPANRIAPHERNVGGYAHGKAVRAWSAEGSAVGMRVAPEHGLLLFPCFFQQISPLNVGKVLN